MAVGPPPLRERRSTRWPRTGAGIKPGPALRGRRCGELWHYQDGHFPQEGARAHCAASAPAAAGHRRAPRAAPQATPRTDAGPGSRTPTALPRLCRLRRLHQGQWRLRQPPTVSGQGRPVHPPRPLRASRRMAVQVNRAGLAQTEASVAGPLAVEDQLLRLRMRRTPRAHRWGCRHDEPKLPTAQRGRAGRHRRRLSCARQPLLARAAPLTGWLAPPLARPDQDS